MSNSQGLRADFSATFIFITILCFSVLKTAYSAGQFINNRPVFSFCTTSFTREKVPGVCKPLVKCVRFFHEIPQVVNRPCQLKTGELGVCCPYFSLPPQRPSKLLIVFYFVSDSSEVIDLLFFFFFSHSSPYFSNFHISAILLIFLDIIDCLLLKYEMMNSFSGNLSGFQISSGFSGF